jgi:flagellar biosynthesis/type III secretory pathway protein FliH
MPILDDIMDHEVLGRERRRGIEQGLAQGIEQGLERGREEGERKVVLRLIEQRFGPVPDWAQQRLKTLSSGDLETLELRLLDAPSLEALLA